VDHLARLFGRQFTFPVLFRVKLVLWFLHVICLLLEFQLLTV
jgi:hypothetical protein